MIKLLGKVAVGTGASRGIGQQIAEVSAAEGRGATVTGAGYSQV
jgi:NAD(P)-dependent dehydrogenase (short-subunit alcohol dehydrogenase family)